MTYYTLCGRINRVPVKCENPAQWAEWMKTAQRTVGHDVIGKATVHTEFTGRDSHVGIVPFLFTTKVSGGGFLSGKVWHSSTWEEAESMHFGVVKRLALVIEDLPVIVEGRT